MGLSLPQRTYNIPAAQIYAGGYINCYTWVVAGRTVDATICDVSAGTGWLARPVILQVPVSNKAYIL